MNIITTPFEITPCHSFSDIIAEVASLATIQSIKFKFNVLEITCKGYNSPVLVDCDLSEVDEPINVFTNSFSHVDKFVSFEQIDANSKINIAGGIIKNLIVPVESDIRWIAEYCRVTDMLEFHDNCFVMDLTTPTVDPEIILATGTKYFVADYQYIPRRAYPLEIAERILLANPCALRHDKNIKYRRTTLYSGLDIGENIVDGITTVRFIDPYIDTVKEALEKYYCPNIYIKMESYDQKHANKLFKILSRYSFRKLVIAYEPMDNYDEDENLPYEIDVTPVIAAQNAEELTFSIDIRFDIEALEENCYVQRFITHNPAYPQTRLDQIVYRNCNERRFKRMKCAAPSPSS